MDQLAFTAATYVLVVARWSAQHGEGSTSPPSVCVVQLSARGWRVLETTNITCVWVTVWLWLCVLVSDVRKACCEMRGKWAETHGHPSASVCKYTLEAMRRYSSLEYDSILWLLV